MMNLKALFKSGLWPFSPDPLSPGLYGLGSPAGSIPLLITGNSRHTFNHLERILAPLGVRVLVVDVGGVDVYSAVAAGGWNLDKIEDALKSFDPETGEAAADEPSALLPYPVWAALGGKEIEDLAGWRIRPGPADARHLPAYLALGHKLTNGIKVMPFPLVDRLRLALAHTGLFALIAAIPFLFFGLEVLVAGLAMSTLSAGLLALTWPWLPGESGWFKGACLGLVLAVSTYCVAMLMGAEMAQCAAWALAGLFIILWTASFNSVDLWHSEQHDIQ